MCAGAVRDICPVCPALVVPGSVCSTLGGSRSICSVLGVYSPVGSALVGSSPLCSAQESYSPVSSALVGSRSVCSALGASVRSAPPWWAPGPSAPPWRASVRSALPWWAPVPSSPHCLPHGPGPPSLPLPLFRLRSTAHLVMCRSVWKLLLGGGYVTNPSHELLVTHHQMSLSHHWTLTQLQITLLDYISHHSLHPHSCFTLSRCTCSQSSNHTHTT